MKEELKRDYVRRFEGIRDELRSIPGFIEDAEMRAVFTVLATLEAAIAYNELTPLAEMCAKFCGDKADEVIQNG
jgi:hypothetical protein